MTKRVKICWCLIKGKRHMPRLSLNANCNKTLHARRLVFLSLVCVILYVLLTHLEEILEEQDFLKRNRQNHHQKRRLDDIFILENQSKNIESLLTQRGAFKCIEEMLSAGILPVPTDAFAKNCSYVKHAVKREILFIGDSRIRQQFYSLLEVKL